MVAFLLREIFEVVKMKTAEQVLRDIAYAVAVADDVIRMHRIDDTDQNPKGFRDLLGSAAIKVEKWMKDNPQ